MASVDWHYSSIFKQYHRVLFKFELYEDANKDSDRDVLTFKEARALDGEFLFPTLNVIWLPITYGDLHWTHNVNRNEHNTNAEYNERLFYLLYGFIVLPTHYKRDYSEIARLQCNDGIWERVHEILVIIDPRSYTSNFFLVSYRISEKVNTYYCIG